MIERGFTVAEWNELLRLNDVGEKQEAVRRFLAGISRPIERKSKFPMIRPELREYNLAVSIWESGDRKTAIDLLEALAMGSGAPTVENGVLRFGLFGRKQRGRQRVQANIRVKLFNSGINPLNPVAANDRTSGEYPDIEPGNVYEGFVYFPYLAAWLRGGRKAKLLGV